MEDVQPLSCSQRDQRCVVGDHSGCDSGGYKEEVGARLEVGGQ